MSRHAAYLVADLHKCIEFCVLLQLFLSQPALKAHSCVHHRALSSITVAGVVGGAKWEGSKVSFDDAEAAEGGSEQTTVAVEAVAVAQGATEAEDEAPSSPPAAAAKRFPFNKCIKAALQQVSAVIIILIV